VSLSVELLTILFSQRADKKAMCAIALFACVSAFLHEAQRWNIDH